MSSPSAEHEERVRLLEAVAVLAGFTSSIAFDPPLEPDVFRIDFARRSVFVGDAKATETTGCEATKARLTQYAHAARSWCAVGADAVLAIAHGQPHQAEGWRNMLQDVVAVAGLRVAAGATTYLDQGCLLAWVYVPATSKPTRSGSSTTRGIVRLGAFLPREAGASSAGEATSATAG